MFYGNHFGLTRILRRKATTRTLSAVVAVFGCMSTQTQESHAQQRPHRTFSEVLGMLARERHIAVIAESTPADNPADAEAILARSPQSTPAIIESIAACYGYSSRQFGAAFALAKLYRGRSELPEVTLQECNASLSAIRDNLEPFDPHLITYHPLYSPIAADIAGMLTTGQKSALAAGNLPVASLTPTQRETVRRLAMHYFVHRSAVASEKAFAAFSLASGGKVSFSKELVNGTEVFGYTCTQDRANHAFTPLDTVPRMAAATGDVSESFDKATGTYIRDEVPADPAAPRTADRRDTITLAEAMRKIGRFGKSGEHFQAEATIAEKSVTVAGLENAPASDSLAALAHVYGLRIRALDHEIVLDLKHPVTAHTPFQIPRCLWNAVPDCVRRAVSNRSDLHDDSRDPAPQKQRRSAQDDLRASGRIYELACVLLKDHVQPLLKSAVDRHVSYSTLHTDDKMLFALALFMRYGEAIGGAMDMGRESVPPWIASFDNLVLAGKFTTGNDGKPRLAFFMCLPDRSGRLKMYAGFTNGFLPR
jgi:hypothetical protein